MKDIIKSNEQWTYICAVCCDEVRRIDDEGRCERCGEWLDTLRWELNMEEEQK